MSKAILSYLIILFAFSLVSCNQSKPPAQLETTVTKYDVYKGVLNVSCDAGLEPIIKQQTEVFQYLHDSVRCNVLYSSEKEMFADFRSKKTNVMLLSRALATTEVNDFKNIDTIYIRELPIAYDAVALIASKDFDDSRLTVEQVKQYFSPSASAGNSPRLVFENQNSTVVRYVLNSLGYHEKVSSNVYAMQSADEVIAYVTDNKNALGFIPYNRLSDTDDPRVKLLLERIKILSLTVKIKDGEERRVSANQSDIAAGDYPFIRTIHAVTRYTYTDNLELLFMGFLSREKGAKIFLKAGLIPVKTPEREIIVNDNGIKAGR